MKRAILVTVTSVATDKAAIVYQPTTGFVGRITAISVTGPALIGYTIHIYKQLGRSGDVTIPLFSFTLNPGDTVQSDTTFILNPVDSILALSSTPSVTIVIQGEEDDTGI